MKYVLQKLNYQKENLFETRFFKEIFEESLPASLIPDIALSLAKKS